MDVVTLALAKKYTDEHGGGMTATSAILQSNNWVNNIQTVSVSGVTATNTIIYSPHPSSQDAYVQYGIKCVAQDAGVLTFTCTATPLVNITVNILVSA